MTYSKEDIDAMRETLHELELEALKDRDLIAENKVIRILWEGCIGWKNTPDAEVVEEYQNIYGETDNVEIVTLNESQQDQHYSSSIQRHP